MDTVGITPIEVGKEVIDGTEYDVTPVPPVKKVPVLESKTVKAYYPPDRPEFLAVSVDMTVDEIKSKDKDLQSVFKNEFLHADIDYSNFKEVAIAFAVDGNVVATGVLLNPSKFDPSRKG